MDQRKLGNIPVSPLGIGAMSFAGAYGNATQEQSHAVMDLAMERGVTHIDTSNIYGMGKSEQIVGSFLAKRGAAARDHFKIATKAGIHIDPETGTRSIRNPRAYMESELDKSLQRLGVDHVDLFYAHRYDATMPIEEVVEGMAEIVKTGKTKSIGLSEVAPSTLRRAAAVTPIAAVQSEYSLSTRAPELGLVQACAEVGATLVAFSSVGRGLITDTPHTREFIETSAFLKVNPRFMEPNYSANLKLLEPFRALAADMGLSAAGLAIAWVLAQGEHVVSIPGTRNTAHFNELADGAERKLTADEVATIEKTLPVGWCHGDRYNRDQWIGPEIYS